MAKKKAKKAKGKGANKSANTASKTKAEIRREKLSKLQKVSKKGSTSWNHVSSVNVICLPKKRGMSVCNCMANTMEQGGKYDPKSCALHTHENIEHLTVSTPTIPTDAIHRAYERQNQQMLRERDGGAIRSVLLQRKREPIHQNELEMMIREYSNLLSNKHCTTMTCDDKAECLVRLSSLLLASVPPRSLEALQSSEIAIGFRPTFSAAYFSAGQAYFNLKKYQKAVDRFRAGLKEDPLNETLLFAFRKAVLEVNVARERKQVRRPLLIPTSTIVRDDLGTPSWMKLKVLKNIEGNKS